MGGEEKSIRIDSDLFQQQEGTGIALHLTRRVCISTSLALELLIVLFPPPSLTVSLINYLSLDVLS